MNFLNMPITSNYMIQFLIGVITFFPSIFPTLLALKRKPTLKWYNYAKLEDKIMWMPILYGFINLIVFTIVIKFFPKSLRKYWILGIIFGMIYPTLGTINNYAKKMYDLDNYYGLYLKAQIMYIIYYGLIISFIVSRIKK